MEIQSIANSPNFEGQFIIVNNLSNKPAECVKTVENNIKKLISKKNYNLYLKQDYVKQKICFIPDYQFTKPNRENAMLTGTQETVLLNAKPSRYIDAAKNAIKNFDKALLDKEQKEWELKQKRQKIEEIKDIICSIIYFPLFLVGDILHEISPNLSKKFEKLIDKII